MSTYYLYRHIRTDINQPFYIGISKKFKENATTSRVEYERAFTFNPKGRSEYWLKVFNKCNGNIEVDIMCESTSREEIIKKEIEFIKLYGRTRDGGSLVNLTQGGEGRADYVMSDETRRKIGEKHRGKKLSPEHKEKLIKMLADRDWHPTDDHKLKMKEACTGRKHTPEEKARMSAARKGQPNPLKGTKMTEVQRLRYVGNKNTGRKATPEHRHKLRISHLGYVMPEKQKQNISKANKGKKRTEETRKKMSFAQKNNVNAINRLSEINKNRSKKHRHNLSLSLTGKKASPETRAKQSKKAKERCAKKKNNGNQD